MSWQDTRKEICDFNRENRAKIQEDCAFFFDALNLNRFGRGRFYLNEQNQCQAATLLYSDPLTAPAVLYRFQGNSETFNNAIRNTDQFSLFSYPDHQCDMLKFYRQELNISKGITLYNRTETYIDYWDFSGDEDANLSNVFSEEKLKYFKGIAAEFDRLNQVNIDESLFSLPEKIDYSPNDQLPVLNINQNLSEREIRCLALLNRGLGYKSIARELEISPRTVEYHLNNIKTKIGLNDRAALIQYFFNHF